MIKAKQEKVPYSLHQVDIGISQGYEVDIFIYIC